MKKTSNEQMIKACMMYGALAIILIIIIAIIMKYQVEGEKNPPFYISEMSVISTAEGIGNNENEAMWDMNIYQNNDIYLKIEKNEKNNKETIRKVAIENLKVTKKPQKGNIKFYMPNSVPGRDFSYDSKYIFENKLNFKGSSKTNQRNLEIGNQGGMVTFRVSNVDVGTFKSNEEQDGVIHNGTILKKIDANIDEVKFNTEFDLCIYIGKKVYKTKVQLELPSGNIIEDGISYIENKDMSNLIYKRYLARD